MPSIRRPAIQLRQSRPSIHCSVVQPILGSDHPWSTDPSSIYPCAGPSLPCSSLRSLAHPCARWSILALAGPSLRLLVHPWTIVFPSLYSLRIGNRAYPRRIAMKSVCGPTCRSRSSRLKRPTGQLGPGEPQRRRQTLRTVEYQEPMQPHIQGGTACRLRTSPTFLTRSLRSPRRGNER